MKLISFLLREIGNVKEDRRSIRFRRPYHQNDLKNLLPIMDECSKTGVHASLAVNVDIDDRKEVCFLNFQIKKQGIELLLENASATEKLTRMVAAALSVEGQPESLVHVFEQLIRMTGARFEIEVYVEKSELTQLYDKELPGSHYIWLTAENLRNSLVKDSRGLLRQIWSGSFPLLVIPTIGKPKYYNFCSIFADAGQVNSNNEVWFSSAKSLAEEMLRYGEATPLLLALTFGPRDEESEQFLRTSLGLNFTGKAELPFAESQFYDFKARPPAEISKVIAAFANACGGIIVFGIDAKGNVTGCNKVKDVDEVSNSLKEIEPAPIHRLIQTYVGDRFVFGIVISPPGEQVYSLSDGKRPFRQGAATRYFRHDEQILDARKQTCVSVFT